MKEERLYLFMNMHKSWKWIYWIILCGALPLVHIWRHDLALMGLNADMEIFDGLSHEFGLVEGTVAEGWIDNVIVL